MPGGRPTLYDPRYCEEIVAFCAEGFSLTGFAGHIGVSRQSITEWASVHPEFSLAVRRAKAACGLAWERKSMKVADGHGGPGASTVCVFGMKNMAPDDWADVSETRHSGGINITRHVVKGRAKPELEDG